MEVKHSKTFFNIPNYSIEWGYSTWTEGEEEEDKDWSIRNRYDRADGGFNLRGSSEIPWADFKRLIQQSIIENQFSNNELTSLFRTALLKRIKNIFKK